MHKVIIILGWLFATTALGAQTYEIAEAYFPENGAPVEFALSEMDIQTKTLILNREEYEFHQVEVLCNGDLKITYQQKWGYVHLFVRQNKILHVMEYPSIGATVAYEFDPRAVLPSETIQKLDPRLHLHLEKGWLLYNP